MVFLRDGRVTDQTLPAVTGTRSPCSRPDGRGERHGRKRARGRQRGRPRAAGGHPLGQVRLLRREWRQQLLILALITVAVAATFVGSAVATNTPPPAGAGFGTAADMATFPFVEPAR